MSSRPKRQVAAAPKARSASVDRAVRASSSSRLWWIVAVVAVVIVGATVVALVIGGGSNDAEGGVASDSGGTVVPNGENDTATVQVDGTPLPTLGDPGQPDAAVGMTAPVLKGQQFDGAEITIGEPGTPQIVMFVTHWCPHCQAEVPRIQEYLNENGMPEDVNLLAVSTSADPSRVNSPPGAWLRREGWSVPTMVDSADGTAAKAYGLSGFPYFVVLGGDGQVIQRTSGELTTEQFEALLEAARSAKAVDVQGEGSSDATAADGETTTSTAAGASTTAPGGGSVDPAAADPGAADAERSEGTGTTTVPPDSEGTGATTVPPEEGAGATTTAG